MTDIYQVDAFADTLFEGNPAAVVLLDEWPDDLLLQSIAAENNLAETAYLVASGNQWELRWFTPTVEVALCGHATLAAAHVLYNHLGSTPSSFWADRLDKTALRARQISPRSGTLGCRVLGDRVELTGRAVDYLKGSLSF